MGGQMPPQMGGQMGGMPGQMGGQMPNQMSAQQMGMGFMPGASMPQGYNPNFAAMPGGAAQQGAQNPFPVLPPNLAAQQAETNRQYQFKLQQQQQMANLQRQRAAQAAAMNPMMAQQAQQAQQHPNMGTPTRAPQPSNAPANPQVMQSRSFLRQVGAYMQQSGRPFDANPVIAGRQINLWFLFQIIVKMKGSKTVSAHNQWPKVAAAMQFDPVQFPSAAMETKEIFERCLGPYEAAYWQNAAQQNQKKAAEIMPPNQMPGQQMSPTRSMPQTPQQQQPSMPQIQQRMGQTPQGQMTQMTPVQANANIPGANGWSTPDAGSIKAQNSVMNSRKSLSRPPGSPAPMPQPVFPTPSPATADRHQPPTTIASKLNGALEPVNAGDDVENTTYVPNIRTMNLSYGGLEVDQFTPFVTDIARFKPVVPEVMEMGLIDIRAISLSLQSGIQREVRYALDVLAKMSGSQVLYLELEHCDDLLDILIDCAEEQVDILADGAPEVSDGIDLMSYEDIVRHAKVEVYSLQDIPETGSTAYNLERAAERVIAITTILRNLSFPLQHLERNAYILANPLVIKFISNTIRLLGTRNMLLRSYYNTQDFMKDIVVFLSNVADKISLPSREDASNLLHFLLAFGPSPDPSTLKDLRFSFYKPTLHRYYPPAIDGLAKLMLLDPNRTYFKHVFSESTSASSHALTSPSPTSAKAAPVHQQYDLITRAFGLALAVLPDRSGLQLPDERIALLREATLSQGLLAADIISGLLPSSQGPDLARAWLGSQDCWVPSLLNLCHSIFNDHHALASETWRAVMNRAFGMLRRLATLGFGKNGKRRHHGAVKSVEHVDSPGSPQQNGGHEPGSSPMHIEGQTEDDKALSKLKTIKRGTDAAEADERRKMWDGINADILPNWSAVVGALVMSDMDLGVLKEMVALAALDE
jgi:SWI/SNF chromatin-remodeling complex subunit SWI1